MQSLLGLCANLAVLGSLNSDSAYWPGPIIRICSDSFWCTALSACQGADVAFSFAEREAQFKGGMWWQMVARVDQLAGSRSFGVLPSFRFHAGERLEAVPFLSHAPCGYLSLSGLTRSWNRLCVHTVPLLQSSVLVLSLYIFRFLMFLMFFLVLGQVQQPALYLLQHRARLALALCETDLLPLVLDSLEGLGAKPSW